MRLINVICNFVFHFLYCFCFGLVVVINHKCMLLTVGGSKVAVGQLRSRCKKLPATVLVLLRSNTNIYCLLTSSCSFHSHNIMREEKQVITFTRVSPCGAGQGILPQSKNYDKCTITKIWSLPISVHLH